MHYVYYLYSLSGQLLYIGRSINPIDRQRAFKRRTGIDTVMGPCQRHKTFEKAAQAEIAAILRHEPPHNKWLISSVGNLGRKRGPMSASTRALIGAANKGHIKSEATKEKLRIARANQTPPGLGKTISEETRSKIRTTLKARYERKN